MERAFTLIDLGMGAGAPKDDDRAGAHEADTDSRVAAPWEVTRVRQLWVLPSGDVREERLLFSSDH